MGAGNPKFKICVTMSAGWKKNSTPGNCARQIFAQPADVIRRRMMMLLIQAHQNFSVAGADHAGVAVGQVDAGVGQPDVVEDRVQFVFGDLLPQIGFDLVAQARGFFHSQSGTRPHVKTHQAGIDAREEILAQEEHQTHRQHAEGEEAGGEELAMLQRRFQQLIVAVAELIEAALKSALKASENRLRPRRLVLVAAHDVHHQRRNQSSREEIGRQHGEHHGFRQRHKQETAPRR